MRYVMANDRELSGTEMRRFQLRQRRVYRLGYVVFAARKRRRVVAFHSVGRDSERASSPAGEE